jgi:hypothetical protein
MHQHVTYSITICTTQKEEGKTNSITIYSAGRIIQRSVAVSVIYIHIHWICSSDFWFLIGEANSDFNCCGFCEREVRREMSDVKELARDSWF